MVQHVRQGHACDQRTQQWPLYTSPNRKYVLRIACILDIGCWMRNVPACTRIHDRLAAETRMQAMWSCNFAHYSFGVQRELSVSWGILLISSYIFRIATVLGFRCRFVIWVNLTATSVYT